MQVLNKTKIKAIVTCIYLKLICIQEHVLQRTGLSGYRDYCFKLKADDIIARPL